MDKLQIKVDLAGKLKKEFLEIKTRKGIKKNTDVIRYLIEFTFLEVLGDCRIDARHCHFC